MNTHSYYFATAHPAPEHPPLQETIEADVCVIGGGIAGCSTALHLAERGYRVVLLEGQHIGWGASGRSGSRRSSAMRAAKRSSSPRLGRDDARKLWDISDRSRSTCCASPVTKHAIDCDLHWGALHVAIKARQREELLAEQREAETQYGYTKLRFLERADVAALLDTQRYCAGSLDSGSGHLHPLNYTLGLARAAEAAGVRIFERSQVTKVTPASARSYDTPWRSTSNT